MGIDEENKIKRLKAENNRLKKQIRLMKDKTKKRGLHTLWLFCVLDMRKEENEKLDRENKILRGRIKKLVKSYRVLKDHIKKNEELGRLAKRIIEERTFQNGNY